jgi:hypothetical protein
MKNGMIRQLVWTKPAQVATAAALRAAPGDPTLLAIAGVGFPSCPSARSPREEAICLLKVAAEIEHALLVQYLYAAYSLEMDPKKFRGSHPPKNAAALVLGDGTDTNPGWRKDVLKIAKEEMGHLVTVQNLLQLLVGGAPYVGRENYPIHADIYPFPLVLQPLGKDSLAKYVTAEMPVLDGLTWELQEIVQTATASAMVPVNHVGVLYARLYYLFMKDGSRQGPWDLSAVEFFPNKHLKDTDFKKPADNADYQATPLEWQLTPESSIHVRPVLNRDDALKAIHEIAVQGEGLLDDDHSHYRRFLSIYREFVLYAGPTLWIPTRDVPSDPYTPEGNGERPAPGPGEITNEATLAVARLLNVRYRMLLAYIRHALALKRGAAATATASRQDFVDWAINTEMQTGVSELAVALTGLPRTDRPADGVAAAPFELPDDPFPPNDEAKLWRVHRQLIEQSTGLFEKIRKAFPAGHPVRKTVDQLEAADKEAIKKFPPAKS